MGAYGTVGEGIRGGRRREERVGQGRAGGEGRVQKGRVLGKEG